MSSANSDDTTPRLNREEIDHLLLQAEKAPVTDTAGWNAMMKLYDHSMADESSASRGCQKCKEEIGEGEEYTARFGHFYHERCIPDVN